MKGRICLPKPNDAGCLRQDRIICEPGAAMSPVEGGNSVTRMES